ncbi:hypothetical protein LuPra_04545 [Luteitalea pratensis]|uniref:Uncharacterized protein n=1 Tax=Luteitalea pratensis TaxID=1855912 RepID=A0A143PRF2_LUTPR|nr:helix-turn-helix domain-containing protein [Luteitalea pratensis]AMY11297.1 hypothetical protein LuPra_04545 [Luteitalea pratensis]
MTGHESRFARIDVRQWARACALGMNAALAFVCLNLGRMGKTTTTKWGATGIATHVGMSKAQARQALQALEAEGLVRSIRDGLRSIVDSGAGIFAWVPQSVVFGVEGNRVPPMELLREYADPMLLRLFVDMYERHDLPGVGGLPPCVLHERWDKHVLFRSPAWHVVAFTSNHSLHTPLSPDDDLIRPHVVRAGASGTDNYDAWWCRCKDLRATGLLTRVLRLAESADADAATAITFWPAEWQGHDTPEEARVGTAAEAVVQAMLRKNHDAWNDVRALQATGTVVLLPLPAHMVPQATLQTVYRLRYRPHTKETQAWYAWLSHQADVWTQAFHDVEVQWGDSISAAEERERREAGRI